MYCVTAPDDVSTILNPEAYLFRWRATWPRSTSSRSAPGAMPGIDDPQVQEQLAELPNVPHNWMMSNASGAARSRQLPCKCQDTVMLSTAMD